MKNLSSLIKTQEFRLKLYPKNFDASRHFYEKILGFSVIKEWNDAEDDKGVMFNVGGTVLELLTGGNGVRGGTDISLQVPDVWTLWEAVKGDLNIKHALRNNKWGDTSFCVSDPEGFEISFFTKTC